MKVGQRTDLYVGAFLVSVVGIVITALVVTSGWGIKHFDLFIRTDDARDIAIDTKIYLQGLEVGRVVAINPQPDPSESGALAFIIRAQMLAEFKDGDSLILTRNMDAEVEAGLLSGATLTLDVHNATNREAAGSCSRVVLPGRLMPGDTICMHRKPAAMQAIGALANDLKSTISDAIVAATGTLNAYRRLADSLTLATGTARSFVQGIRPGTEQTLNEAALNLARVRRLLDTTDVRSGVTLHELNLTMEQTRATMEQSRRLMTSADSLTRLLTTMGAENRPELRAMLLDARFLTQQLMYVMEQISRRPMRAMSGVELPDSLTAEGRARKAREDSARTRQP
jgi:ABC-type transporter Mla subunit MlaD